MVEKVISSGILGVIVQRFEPFYVFNSSYMSRGIEKYLSTSAYRNHVEVARYLNNDKYDELIELSLIQANI